jgi:hypothetical protein
MTADQRCTDKTLIVTYLYGECDADERRLVEDHAATCAECAAELEQLRSVRATLDEWSAPGRELSGRIVGPIAEVAASRDPVGSHRSWTAPWWLQAAAAMLLLGAAAGFARIEVRYDEDGLVVRTGWSESGSSEAVASPVSLPAEEWRQELTAFEQEIRSQLSTIENREPAPPATARVSAAGEAALLGQVRDLIDSSERRLERELTEQMLGVMREVELQRRTDLRGIQQTFGELEGQTDIAVWQNQEMLNYLRRVSQQR